MDHRSKYSYWDRDELLETVKEKPIRSYMVSDQSPGFMMS